jgi:hypothetical protein
MTDEDIERAADIERATPIREGDTKMPWTRFMDMHSGGGCKENFERLYVEAPEAEAKIIFFNRFGHNPDRVSCTCCGPDYSIDEEPTLAEASAYDRGCAWDKAKGGYVERKAESTTYAPEYQTVEDLLKTKRVTNGSVGDRAEFIFAKDIKAEERIGDLPEQGYVWID